MSRLQDNLFFINIVHVVRIFFPFFDPRLKQIYSATKVTILFGRLDETGFPHFLLDFDDLVLCDKVFANHVVKNADGAGHLVAFVPNKLFDVQKYSQDIGNSGFIVVCRHDLYSNEILLF